MAELEIEKELIPRPKRRQRIFMRKATFVAVKPIRLRKAATIDVGEIIPADMLRSYHLMSLFKRMFIGDLLDSWTEGAVETWGEKNNVQGIKIRDFNTGSKSISDIGPLVHNGSTHCIYAVGGPWYSVRDAKGKEVEKLRGKNALQEWIDTNEGTKEEIKTNPEDVSEDDGEEQRT